MTESTSDRPWLLAIDTSTGQASLALTDGVAMAEVSWLAERNQTVSVLPQIDSLVSMAGIEAARIGAVAVATGPGMFSGLRVGMSLAKGFHLGQDAVLIGVPTLHVTAQQFGWAGQTVVATVAAGRGRLVWQFFPGGVNPVNGSIDDLLSAIGQCAEAMIVAGDLTDEQAAQIMQLTHVTVPSAAERNRRVAVLAEIGWRRFIAGETDDPTALAPTYVHSTGTVAQN